jgi:hypothetical protein
VQCNGSLTINSTDDITKAFRIIDGNSGTVHFQVMGDGDIYGREVYLTVGTFPDYVFDENYDLMSLSQLKEYIDINKHLPGIPSATEISANDNKVKIAEIQTKLLEKVEELTLYIIDLQNQINELKK